MNSELLFSICVSKKFGEFSLMTTFKDTQNLNSRMKKVIKSTFESGKRIPPT